MHDDLKRRLRDELDREVRTPPRLDYATVLARGRGKRLRLRLVTALSVAAAGAAIFAGAMAVTGVPDGRPVERVDPAEGERSFARYRIELGNGFDAGGEPVTMRGSVEADAEDGEICVDASVMGATSLHLHRHDGSQEVSFPWRYVSSRSCRPAPDDVVESLIDSHEDWYVEFHHDGTGGTIRSELQPLPESPPEDRAAAEVIEDLRARARLCRSYDFQFKGSLDGQLYRPVQCGAQTRVQDVFSSPPASPLPIEYVRGPVVIVYGFADVASRDTWLEAVEAPLGGRVVGPTWVVDVMDRSSYRKIAAALRDAERAVRPAGTRSLGPGVVETSSSRRRPEVSMAEAVAVARGEEELVQVDRVLYRDAAAGGARAIPAWHVVLRRCVAAYGDPHDEPGCEGYQTHVIVDEETGAIVAEFVI